jgi:transposase-like protein
MQNLQGKAMRCPFCDSKRVTDYTTRRKCRACGRLYTITVKEVVAEICYKCDKPIENPAKQVVMGNGKIKHVRCRRTG